MRFSAEKTVCNNIKLSTFTLQCNYCDLKTFSPRISIDHEVHWHKQKTSVKQLTITCPDCEHSEKVKL